MVDVKYAGYPGLDIFSVEYMDDKSTHIKNYVLYISMLVLGALSLIFRKKAAHIISILGPALACYVQYRLLAQFLGDDAIATLAIPAGVSVITYVLFMAATSIMPYLSLSFLMSFTVMFLYYNIMAYLEKTETLFIALGAAAFGGTLLFSLLMFVGAGDMPWTVHRLIRRKGAVRSYFGAIMDCLSDVSMNIRAVKVPVPYVEVEPSYLTRLYTMLIISGFSAFLLTSGSFFFANVYHLRMNSFSIGLMCAADQGVRLQFIKLMGDQDQSVPQIAKFNGICWGALTLGIMFIRSTMFDGLMSLLFQAAQRRRGGMYADEKSVGGPIYASSVTTPTRVIENHHHDMHDMGVVHRV